MVSSSTLKDKHVQNYAFINSQSQADYSKSLRSIVLGPLGNGCRGLQATSFGRGGLEASQYNQIACRSARTMLFTYPSWQSNACDYP
jgi:hypothetical protein